MVPESRAHRPGLSLGYRILLIDDDPRIVEAFEDGLSLLGHEVKSTIKGADALRLMQLVDPDVVVTDLIMPEVDIMDAFEQMREIRSSVRIIAISGNPQLLTVAVARGADDVLAKPFDLKWLDLKIRAAMG
jgi:DNA-binding response OmpR family regulator